MAGRDFVRLAPSGSRKEYVVLTGVVEKEKRVWVATCTELGVAAQARSIDDALERLLEACALQMSVLEEVDELDSFLKRHQIPVYKTAPKTPRLEVSNLKPGTLATTLVQPLPARTNDRDLAYV